MRRVFVDDFFRRNSRGKRYEGDIKLRLKEILILRTKEIIAT